MSALIKTIKVGQRELRLDDATYRALVARVTHGKTSAKDCTEREQLAVLEEMRRLGFARLPRRRAGGTQGRPMASTPLGGKIRALWLNLWHLGELSDASEAALGAYAKRMCGVEALQWLDERQADRVIRALRGWLGRVGYVEPDAHTQEQMNLARAMDELEALDHGQACKVKLIARQIAIIAREQPELIREPNIGRAEELDPMIERLGARVRAVKGRA